MFRFFPILSIFKFRFRTFLLVLLSVFSCSITLLFLTAKPVLAGVPAWGWVQYGLYDDSASCTSQLQSYFNNRIAGSPGFTGANTQGNVVYAISGQNMIVNFCVDQPRDKVSVVSFVVGYNRAETDRITKFIDGVRPHFANY